MCVAAPGVYFKKGPSQVINLHECREGRGRFKTPLSAPKLLAFEKRDCKRVGSSDADYVIILAHRDRCCKIDFFSLESFPLCFLSLSTDMRFETRYKLNDPTS